MQRPRVCALGLFVFGSLLFAQGALFPGVGAAGHQVEDGGEDVEDRHHAPEGEEEGFAQGVPGGVEFAVSEFNQRADGGDNEWYQIECREYLKVHFVPPSCFYDYKYIWFNAVWG